MGAMQRRKGATAERELFGLLSDELGTVVKRNLSQTRGGGADTLDVPGWAIEVKRQEAESISAWWKQALEQAESSGRKPILFYRASRQPWRAVVDLAELAPSIYEAGMGARAILEFDSACQLMRAKIGEVNP